MKKIILFIAILCLGISSVFSQKQLREYQYWFDNDFANVVTRPTPPMDTVQIIDNIHAGALRSGMHVYHFSKW